MAKQINHGTVTGYRLDGCRCKACTQASTAANRRWRASVRGKRDIPHGTRNAFDNYGCRCHDCTAAKAASRAAARDLTRRIQAARGTAA